MWIDCWLPLLQSTARMCCDRRRQVRAHALTYLQRSLLHPDLQFLTSHHWEHAFNAVLFPLLAALLQLGRQGQDLEEARVRVCAQILPKVFLQHLAALNRLTTFTALWLTILDFMDCYYKLNVDPLSEAITESLKNILLVMETSGVLLLGDDKSQLLKLTWDRLQLFLPHLRAELCIKQQQQGEEEASSLQQPQTVMQGVPVVTGTQSVASVPVTSEAVESSSTAPAIEQTSSPNAMSPESPPPSAMPVVDPPVSLPQSEEQTIPTPPTVPVAEGELSQTQQPQQAQ